MYTEIKTFEDACKALSLDVATVIPDFSGYPPKHQAAQIAHSKLVIIAEALNGGWAPDWDNNNEYKYYPYFDMEKGFSFCIYDDFYTHSSTGSRLCFKNRELAQYAGEKFLTLYKQYFTYSK